MFSEVFALQIILLLVALIQSQQNPISYARLVGEINLERINQNVVISPLSIETALALTYIGAEGKTAEELSSSLGLNSSIVSKEDAAQHYQKLLADIESNANLTFKIANRIYVSQTLQLAPEFQRIASEYFAAKGEEVNFGDNKKLANKINHWIESQTNNKIKNLVSTEMLDKQTAAFLVNAIYFKAKWAKPFQNALTIDRKFYLSKNRHTLVDMMHQSGKFEYASIPELDASALSLPYAGNKVKMLLILPNKVDGLDHLLQHLEIFKFSELLTKLHKTLVNVAIPKFKFEFGLSLKPILAFLGLRNIFSPDANFSALVKNTRPIAISDVIHKTFIDVNEGNEEGFEAAAATVAQDLTRSHGTMIPYFIGDNPFFFAIYSNETVILAGHVANPNL